MQAEQSDQEEGGAVGLAETCAVRDNILNKVFYKLRHFDHFKTLYMQVEQSGLVKGEALNKDGEKRGNILVKVID